MTQSDDFFGEFEPHTLDKLRILEAYFERWGRKLLLRNGAGSRVVYVDACAGRGIDDEGNHGSPVVAARAAVMAQAQLTEMLGRKITLQVIAIEKNAAHFAELQHNLAPFGDGIRAVRGTLAEHLSAIEAEFGDAPTLYFIDPFGIEPLDGSLVKRCLAQPKNEALILFADQAALRHFGAAVSQQTKAEKELAAFESQKMLELFADIEASEHVALSSRAKRSKEAQALTKEAAIAIMNGAFLSHDWLGEVEAVPPKKRRDKFVELYLQFLQECGAPYRLRIPVRKTDGSRAYTLVHASKSPHGYTTMKEAVESRLKRGPLSPEVVELIRRDMMVDIGKIAKMVRDQFAGQTVGWAETNEPSIRRYALQSSPIMPADLGALAEHLSPDRDASFGRKQFYTFPELLRP